MLLLRKHVRKPNKTNDIMFAIPSTMKTNFTCDSGEDGEQRRVGLVKISAPNVTWGKCTMELHHMSEFSIFYDVETWDWPWPLSGSCVSTTSAFSGAIYILFYTSREFYFVLGIDSKAIHLHDLSEVSPDIYACHFTYIFLFTMIFVVNLQFHKLGWL